jgi:hypothetical protein
MARVTFRVAGMGKKYDWLQEIKRDRKPFAMGVAGANVLLVLFIGLIAVVTLALFGSPTQGFAAFWETRVMPAVVIFAVSGILYQFGRLMALRWLEGPSASSLGSKPLPGAARAPLVAFLLGPSDVDLAVQVAITVVVSDAMILAVYADGDLVQRWLVYEIACPRI